MKVTKLINAIDDVTIREIASSKDVASCRQRIINAIKKVKK